MKVSTPAGGMTSDLSSASHHLSEAAALRVHMQAEELPNNPMQTNGR